MYVFGTIIKSELIRKAFLVLLFANHTSTKVMKGRKGEGREGGRETITQQLEQGNIDIRKGNSARGIKARPGTVPCAHAHLGLKRREKVK